MAERKTVAFTPRMFYGPNKATTLPVSIRIKRRLQAIEENHIPKAYTTRLTGPCGSWKTFHRQKDAFDFVKSASQDLHVWSFESDIFVEHRGQRLYLAASCQQFWHYYKQLAPSKRHHYEVIPEGAHCHLYFDLEFSTKVNLGLDGPKMVDIFIRFVCYQLKAVYNIHCTKSDVLQLDASIPNKFSQHLIFLLEKVAFTDNIHAGGFVEHICCLIEDLSDGTCHGTIDFQVSPQDAPTGSDESEKATLNHQNEEMAVKPTPGTKPLCLFLNKDQGQNLAAQHDTGQLRSEIPGSEQPCVSGEAPQNLNKPHRCKDHLQALKDADLTPSDLGSLFVNDKEGKRVIFCDRGVYTKNRNFRLFLSSKMGRENPLVVAKSSLLCTASSPEQVFMHSLICNVRHVANLRLLLWDGVYLGHSRISNTNQDQRTEIHNQPTASAEGYCMLSPYPEVDTFVTSLLSHDGRHGNIRRWSYFQDAELLIYDIVGNRWCHNVGRQHRSNNIMILANLQRGVYYQKCHDPDCNAINFKSQEWPLPSNILPANILGDDDDFPNVTNPNLLLDDDVASLDDAILRHMDIDAGDAHGDVTGPHDVDVWDPLPYDDIIATELLISDDVCDDELLAADVSGDIVTDDDFQLLAADVSSDIVTDDDVELSAAHISGDIVTDDDVALLGADISGDIVTDDGVELSASDISDDIVTDDGVELSASDISDDIIVTDDDVELSVAEISGDIVTDDDAELLAADMCDDLIVTDDDVDDNILLGAAMVTRETNFVLKSNLLMALDAYEMPQSDILHS